jgi:hypothetical protein
MHLFEWAVYLGKESLEYIVYLVLSEHYIGIFV